MVLQVVTEAADTGFQAPVAEREREQSCATTGTLGRRQADKGRGSGLSGGWTRRSVRLQVAEKQWLTQVRTARREFFRT